MLSIPVAVVVLELEFACYETSVGLSSGPHLGRCHFLLYMNMNSVRKRCKEILPLNTWRGVTYLGDN